MIDAADPHRSGSAGRRWAAIAAALLLPAAWLVGHPGSAATPRPAAAAPHPAPAGAADHPPWLHPAHAPLPGAVPERIDIGSIGLHAALVPRGLTDGTVDPPPYTTPEVAGWYRGGPTPGAAGAALVVGHVDTETGPAVFYDLGDIHQGAHIDITRHDGTVAQFSVEAVEIVQKSHFDPARVYGSTPRPDLRLITCGGTFDRTARTYSANLVVYATLTGSHPA
ncbi:class F sortase [Streptomyces sp. NBC_01190]|uniref:class F sortase n=1 Tax=Streptomyces sp. NBC_01190 TaxID=2903767 RepID=UPI003869400E|nr:class F sortase [Streptomyces sp. NBC_01190]